MTTKHILASWTSISGKGTVRVHEPETGRMVKEFKIPASAFGAIRQVSATHFAVSCDGGAVCLCNVDDGSVVQTFIGTLNGRGLEHIQGSNLLASSGTHEGELFLWDLNPEAEEKKRGELKGHTGSIWRLINPKSLSHLLLSTGGTDKTARVWDWGKEECLKVIDDHHARVHGLAFNEEGSVIMTGGFDRKVMMWDVKNNYDSIRQIGRFSSRVTQLFYRESSHRLSVVTRNGAVRAYDVRNISTRLLKFNAFGSSFRGCDVPDQDLLCLSSTREFSMSAWKDGGSVGWRVPPTRNAPNGICRFAVDSSDSGGVKILPQMIDGSVDAIIEAVESRTIPVVTVRGTDGSMVRVPRSMCPREVLDETLHVGMNLEVLEEKDLLQILMGKKKIAADTPTSKLPVLGRVFRALHLPTHLYLLCQFIEKISDPVRVASLALSRDDLVAKLEDWKGEKREEVEGLDVISEAILRALVRLDWTTVPVVQAFRRTSASLSVFGICQFVTAPARPLCDHPDLSDLDDPAKASDVFPKLLDPAELYESRRCTNAALTSSDGGKEEVHVEILLSRSSFFHHMLSFGGAELESLKKTKTILLENFTSDELSAYVSWIYLGTYPKSVGFRIHVRLLTHFHMHGETAAENTALRGCLDRIRALEGQELILRLLENGHLIMNSLPEDLQTRLVTCAVRRLGLPDEAVRSYLSFADDLGSRVDEAHAKVEEKAAVNDQLTSQIDRQASRIGQQASQIDRQGSEIDQQASQIVQQASEIDQQALRIGELASEIEQQASQIGQLTSQIDVLNRERRGCVCRKRRRSEEDGSEGDGDDLEDDSDSADSKEAKKKKRRKLNPD